MKDEDTNKNEAEMFSIVRQKGEHNHLVNDIINN